MATEGSGTVWGVVEISENYTFRLLKNMNKLLAFLDKKCVNNNQTTILDYFVFCYHILAYFHFFSSGEILTCLISIYIIHPLSKLRKFDKQLNMSEI